MAIHPLSRQTRPQRTARRYRPSCAMPTPRASPTSRTKRQPREFRHQRSPRLFLARTFNEGACAGDHPGDLRLPQRPRHRPARCSSARTRTRSPIRPSSPLGKCSAPTASRSWSTVTTATRPRRASRTPSWAITAQNYWPGRRHRDHAIAQSAGGRFGFKYNPPHGGPADTDITRWIEDKANQFLAAGLQPVKRIAYAAARRAAHAYDYVGTYVNDLAAVVDMDAIKNAKPQDRRRSLGRARAWRLLASDHRALRCGY